ncbi:MAG: hypothetical protein L0K27_06030 [Corynebacterium nuruki]|nr:hypothetical protein [Corynebacterium nuruki]
MSRPVPPIVRRRQRLVLAADAGIALILIAAAIRPWQDDPAFILWILGVIVSVVAQLQLRRAIRRQDNRPEDELDEYELQRRNQARRAAMSWALGLLMVVWGTFGLLTLFRKQGPESFDTLIATLYACYYATTAFIIFVPLVILRHIAGGMDRGLVMSGPDAVD